MVRQWIDRHQLAAFMLIAFGWTWAWDGLFYAFDLWEALPVTVPRQWGLPLAAVVVVSASDVSVRAWLGRVLEWRVRPVFYAVALAVPLFVTNVQPVVRAIGGGSLTVSPPGTLTAVVLFVLVNMVLLGGVEELGWRGYLQPRLQDDASVLTTGLAIGVLWWVWHLPLFFTGDPSYSLELLGLATYTTFIVGAAVVFGAFVNVTAGSVVPLMLMHATVNLGAFLAGAGGILDDWPLLPLVVGSGLWWLIAAALVVTYGKRMVPGSPVGLPG